MEAGVRRAELQVPRGRHEVAREIRRRPTTATVSDVPTTFNGTLTFASVNVNGSTGGVHTDSHQLPAGVIQTTARCCPSPLRPSFRSATDPVTKERAPSTGNPSSWRTGWGLASDRQ